MFCKRCGQQVDTSVRFCPRCGEDLTSLTGAGQPGATAPLAAQPPQENETDIVREALKDEYELEKELGRGGMAVVYKARDKQLEREVAIKVLPFSLSFDAEFVERFQREARTAGKLEHPNIIPIYRVGRAGRVIYFVMKFIRGKSLSGVIETRGALPVPEIRRMLIECARALGYAHKHGIVHRDIKPDNIMFDELGQAIVTDFGIAKAQSGARLTGTGMSIGTPHYMSPEQARAQNLDGRSDVYSLGVVGYQCLTGHVPFDGEDSFSIGYKHIMEELPVPPLESAEQRDLFGVIQRMMAKKPDDRFQNAEELIAALESGGAPASMAELSTMPTRAIEPMKPPPKGAPPAPAVVSAATTPLPRASASMAKPKEPAAEAAPAAAPPKPAKPPRRPAPAAGAEPKKSGLGLIAAVLLLVVVGGGGAGYYFGMMRPQQQRDQAARDSVARAESLAAVARADSIRRDSIARAQADSVQLAAATRPTTRPTTAATARPTTTPATAPATTAAAGAREGTLSLSGNIPAGARITVDGQPRTGTRFKLPAGRHRVDIVAEGFRPYSNSSVNIAAGGTRVLTVTLTPATTAATTPVTATPTTAVATRTPATAATPSTPATAAGGTRPDCYTSPTVSLSNPGRTCYDARPVARVPAQLPWPSTCTGQSAPATILVEVSPQGEVSGNPSVQRSSRCDAFDAAARAQALDMTFQPATKNGQPVKAWFNVQFTVIRQ